MNIAYPVSAPDRWQTDSANPPKAHTAAKDFESLLIGQMLHSIHEDGSSWLGTEDDDAAATASGFGEDELAKALANSGGLGLARIIESGLAPKPAASELQA